MTVRRPLRALPLAGPVPDLEPLLEEHAREMAPLLVDPRLHTFTGGEPATRAALAERYRRLVVGCFPDGHEQWFNWVLRRRSDGRAVGSVQATVTEQDEALVAEVAWVIGTEHQGRGHAAEAARVLVAWLVDRGVDTVIAHVHPGHHAFQAVARAAGVVATEIVVDGEVRWQWPPADPRPGG